MVHRGRAVVRSVPTMSRQQAATSDEPESPRMSPVPGGPEASAGFPVRAFWSWPLGCALLGGIEAATQLGRIGGGAGAFVLSLFAAAAVGLWAGLLAMLIAILLRRRSVDWTSGSMSRLGDLSAPLLAAIAVVGVLWWGVGATHELFRTRHFDFVEESVQVWRAVAVVGAPAGLLVLYVAMRRFEDRVRASGWGAWVGRVALTVVVVWAFVHLTRGPFVQHFGTAFSLGLVIPAVVVAASWLPREAGRGRRAMALGLAPAVVVLALGAYALDRPSSRALLLHDTRVFPVVHGAAFAFLDRDGDGETGSWAGGSDCDDANEDVGRWHPEVPGNGIDDNCHAGDAASVPLPPPPERIGPGTKLPVVLITLDTVRAEQLELEGYARETMPYLAEYAADARWFSRAYSPSNHTGFSIISILAGQGPEYLVSDPEVYRNHGKRFTAWLPHALAEAGYETWAVNPTLVGDDISVEQMHFEQYYIGPFDHTPKNRGTRSKQVADWVEGFFAEHGGERPLFTWIHMADAHAEHASHEHFPVTSTLDAYDNELRWLDFNLTRILAAVHRRYGDDVVVVITSDHGEEFGARGAYGHGFSLREPVVRVPLLVRAPGVEPGVEARPTNVAGIPATVLSLIGQPPGRMTVPSVLAPEHDTVVLGTPFFWRENRMEVALVEPRWKLIVNRSRDTAVLFDLENDPGETQNLAAAEPAELERMTTRLFDALEQLR